MISEKISEENKRREGRRVLTSRLSGSIVVCASSRCSPGKPYAANVLTNVVKIVTQSKKFQTGAIKPSNLKIRGRVVYDNIHTEEIGSNEPENSLRKEALEVAVEHAFQNLWNYSDRWDMVKR